MSSIRWEPLHVLRSDHICVRVLIIRRDDCGNFSWGSHFFSPLCIWREHISLGFTRCIRDSECVNRTPVFYALGAFGIIRSTQPTVKFSNDSSSKESI